KSHPLQDPPGAPRHAIGMLHRVVDPGRWDDGGQGRGLTAGNLRRGLAEVAPGRGLDAERPGAELDQVEVQLEDPLLREMALEPAGDRELSELAPGGPGRREVEVLGELLRDRRAADLELALFPVLLEGAAHRVPVDALVLPEAGILGDHD